MRSAGARPNMEPVNHTRGRFSIAVRRRVSIVCLLVILNYLVFFLGVYLDSYGGWIDTLGSKLCGATYALGIALIPVAILYAFVRRFQMKVREWDLYGPGLAIILYLVMYMIVWQLPWRWPEWPWRWTAY